MKLVVVLNCIAIFGIVASLYLLFAKQDEKIQIFETFTNLENRQQTFKAEMNERASDIAVLRDELETSLKQVDSLSAELESSQNARSRKRDQLETCQGQEKQLNDDIASGENQRKSTEDEFNKEKATWTSEIATLKKQLAEKSSVCKFVNMTSAEAIKLCGTVQPAAAPK